MARAARELMEAWLSSLAHERRMSPHTLRAYGDDAARFVSFLDGYRGSRTTLATLQKLKPAELRAFLTDRKSTRLNSSHT